MIRQSFFNVQYFHNMYLMELLIAHQINKGVKLGRIKITVYEPAGETHLIVDDDVVIKRYNAIHLMVDKSYDYRAERYRP